MDCLFAKITPVFCKLSERLLFVFSLVPIVLAFAFFPQSVRASTIDFGIPAFTQASDLPGMISGAYNYVLSIAAALAVIMIVYGGVKYVASGGSVSARSDAMDIIKNAIFGIVLLFGAYIILYTINPNLVQLKNPGLTPIPNLPSGNSGTSTSTGDCSFTASPMSGPPPLAVSFSSSDTADVFNWSFGDGSSGSGKTVSHTFQNVGVFNVILKTELNNGTSTAKSCSLQVTVGAAGRISQEQQAAALALKNSGVSFSTAGQCGGVTPGQNIGDMADGDFPRVCSCECPSICPVGGSSGTVAVSLSTLQGLFNVKHGGINFQINSLTGDQHSCSPAGDPHYQGRAADVVPIPRTSDLLSWKALFGALQSNGGSPHYECPGAFTTDASVFKSKCYSGGSVVPNTHIHVEF